METTMQIVVPVKANATNTEIATALRWRANLFDGLEPKAACSVEATATPAIGKGKKTTAPAAATVETETEADDNEDFAAAPAKSTKKSGGKKAAAAATFEDDEPSEEATEETETETAETESEDDGDFMEAAPAKGKKTAAKKITVNDVNDACKAKAASSDRKTVLGILKKKFGVTSVTELKAEQYADVIKAMA